MIIEINRGYCTFIREAETLDEFNKAQAVFTLLVHAQKTEAEVKATLGLTDSEYTTLYNVADTSVQLTTIEDAVTDMATVIQANNDRLTAQTAPPPDPPVLDPTDENEPVDDTSEYARGKRLKSSVI